MPKTPNERTLATLRLRVGCHETPAGTNNGPCVNEAQERTWLRVPGPGQQGWPWCVAEFQLTVWKVFGKEYPRATAEVCDLADDARERGLTIPKEMAKPGDWPCLGCDHITCLVSRDAAAGTFVGLGGNQSDAVQESTYQWSRVTVVISTMRLAALLEGVVAPVTPVKPKRRPVYQVVRGEGEKARVVYTSPFLDAAAFKAAELIRRGATGAKLIKRPPKP